MYASSNVPGIDTQSNSGCVSESTLNCKPPSTYCFDVMRYLPSIFLAFSSSDTLQIHIFPCASSAKFFIEPAYKNLPLCIIAS